MNTQHVQAASGPVVFEPRPTAPVVVSMFEPRPTAPVVVSMFEPAAMPVQPIISCGVRTPAESFFDAFRAVDRNTACGESETAPDMSGAGVVEGEAEGGSKCQNLALALLAPWAFGGPLAAELTAKKPRK